jgi:hypothetical protein
MQETYYDDYTEPEDPPTGTGVLATLFKWTAAVASVALICGVGYWTYKLGQRDAAEVPVIKAMASPMRTQPEDPGGRKTDHQGLSVNEVLAGNQTADLDRPITRAPEPEPLANEDVASGALKPPEPKPVSLAPDEVDVARANSTAEAGEPTAEETIVSQVEQTLATQTADPEATQKPEEGMKVAALTPTSVAFRPKWRPSELRKEAVLRIKPDTVAVLEPVKARKSDVSIGTRMIQLGAFDSEAIAKSQWKKLVGKHGDLLGAKKRYIEQTVSNGRVFFRLRAVGFNTAADTKAMCSALGARGLPCIPVVKR